MCTHQLGYKSDRLFKQFHAVAVAPIDASRRAHRFGRIMNPRRAEIYHHTTWATL